MDRYKWYSSYSVVFSHVMLGMNFDLFSTKRTFLEEVDYIFSPNTHPWIENYVWVFIDQFHGNTRIFCSIDGKMLELKNIMAMDSRDIYVVDVETGKKSYDMVHVALRNYIIRHVFAEDSFNMVREIQQDKSIVLLQVAFDEKFVSDEQISVKLNQLFNEYIISEFGEM